MENKLSIETTEGLRVKLSSAEPITTREVELLLQAMGVSTPEIGLSAPIAPDLMLAGEAFAFGINLEELDGANELKTLVKGLNPAYRGILKNELAKYDLGTYEKDLEARPMYLAEILNKCGDGELSAISKALDKDKALYFRQELAKIKIRAPFEEHANDAIVSNTVELLNGLDADTLKAIRDGLTLDTRKNLRNVAVPDIERYFADENLQQTFKRLTEEQQRLFLETIPTDWLREIVYMIDGKPSEAEVKINGASSIPAQIASALDGLDKPTLDSVISLSTTETLRAFVSYAFSLATPEVLTYYPLAEVLDKLSAPQLKVLRSNISQSTRNALRPFPVVGDDDY